MAIEDLGLPRQIGMLRKIRLHHYKEALNCSYHMNRWREGSITYEGWKIKWSEHMGFVQALNDFFKVDDTAEGDLTREEVARIAAPAPVA